LFLLVVQFFSFEEGALPKEERTAEEKSLAPAQH
jgi:hypothetical protein